jgi:hypothetical protein
MRIAEIRLNHQTQMPLLEPNIRPSTENRAGGHQQHQIPGSRYLVGVSFTGTEGTRGLLSKRVLAYGVSVDLMGCRIRFRIETDLPAVHENLSYHPHTKGR